MSCGMVPGAREITELVAGQDFDGAAAVSGDEIDGFLDGGSGIAAEVAVGVDDARGEGLGPVGFDAIVTGSGPWWGVVRRRFRWRPRSDRGSVVSWCSLLP